MSGSAGTPDAIISNNIITGYECTDVVEYNDNFLPTTLVSYTYELLLDCSESPQNGATRIENALVTRVFAEYMSSDENCYRPQSPWFAAIYSGSPDTVDEEQGCSDFQSVTDDYKRPNLCCSRVEGEMTIRELSEVENEKQWPNIQSWLERQFAEPYGSLAGTNTWDEGRYITRFIGSGAKQSTQSPTVNPSSGPTESLTTFPTASPTNNPTSIPTPSPSPAPTTTPTAAPTTSPAANNVVEVTPPATSSPTAPRASSTTIPTASPTSSPTSSPTVPQREIDFAGVLSSDPIGQAKDDPTLSAVGISVLLVLLCCLCGILGLIFKELRSKKRGKGTDTDSDDSDDSEFSDEDIEARRIPGALGDVDSRRPPSRGLQRSLSNVSNKSYKSADIHDLSANHSKLDVHRCRSAMCPICTQNGILTMQSARRSNVQTYFPVHEEVQNTSNQVPMSPGSRTSSQDGRIRSILPVSYYVEDEDVVPGTNIQFSFSEDGEENNSWACYRA